MNSKFQASSSLANLFFALTTFGALFATGRPAFGQVWIQTSAPSTNWASIASSADGTKFVAANYGGGIYISRSTPTPVLGLTPVGSNLVFRPTEATDSVGSKVFPERKTDDSV